MGHYASEMSSTWGESIDHSDKIIRLREMARNLPLSAFHAQDIVILHNLFHPTNFTNLNENEIKQLHLRIIVWHKLNKHK